MVEAAEVRKVVDVLEELDVPYYIHGGFAQHLRGLPADLNDCDIRVFHADLSEIFVKLLKRLPYTITMYGPRRIRETLYRTQWIGMDARTRFDVCTHMVTELGQHRFEFPFHREDFQNVDYVRWGGARLPVASLDTLLLYLLVNRSGVREYRTDDKAIAAILRLPTFNQTQFENLISSLSCREVLAEMYHDRLERYVLSPSKWHFIPKFA